MLLGPLLSVPDHAYLCAHTYPATHATHAGERGSPHQQPWEPPLLEELFHHVDHGSSSSSSSTSSAQGGPSLAVPGSSGGSAVAAGGGSSGARGGLGAGAPFAGAHDTGGELMFSTDRLRGALYPQPIGLVGGAGDFVGWCKSGLEEGGPQSKSEESAPAHVVK